LRRGDLLEASCDPRFEADPRFKARFGEAGSIVDCPAVAVCNVSSSRAVASRALASRGFGGRVFVGSVVPVCLIGFVASPAVACRALAGFLVLSPVVISCSDDAVVVCVVGSVAGPVVAG
jgi:hypothetical protein